MTDKTIQNLIDETEKERILLNKELVSENRRNIQDLILDDVKLEAKLSAYKQCQAIAKEEEFQAFQEKLKAVEDCKKLDKQEFKEFVEKLKNIISKWTQDVNDTEVILELKSELEQLNPNLTEKKNV